MVKNLLIIYNVMFLSFGNVLFSNIHYSHDHDHDHETEEVHECQECINIENSSNYTINFQEVNFSNNNINQSVFQNSSPIEFKIERIYCTRAPPIS